MKLKGENLMHNVRLRVNVRDHRLAAELPHDFPDGEADVIVLARPAANADGPDGASQSLVEWFRELDRTLRRRMTKEEVDAYLAEERASWE